MKIGGLVEQTNLSFYTITSLKDQPGSAGEVLKLFARAKVNLVYITEGACKDDMATISFCIDSHDENRIDALIKEHVEMHSLSIIKKEYTAMLGIYGPHFREKPAIAALFCVLLGNAGINILNLSSSISTISAIIDVRDLEKAKRVLLSEFELP